MSQLTAPPAREIRQSITRRDHMRRPAASGSVVRRYALAVALVLGALLATMLLNPEQLLAPLFLLAVLMTAWFAGTWPGLLAAIIATASIDYVFIHPRYAWSLKPSEFPQLIVFFIAALIVSWWSNARRRADDDLRRAHDDLDSRVSERTAELEQANRRLQEHASLFDLTHEAIFVRDMNNVVMHWNRGAEELYGWTAQEAAGRVAHELLHTVFCMPLDEINAALVGEEHWEGELVHTRKDGTHVVVSSRWSLQRDPLGAPAILESNRDITKQKQAEALLAGEKRILEMVATGNSLEQILEALCRLVERLAPDALASILLLEGDRLRHGAAPSLPKAYTDVVDGAMIGPVAGSCGTAAYHCKQVIVHDIATDPLWTGYRELALPHSMRACWSTPVLSSEGHVMATFAMYYRKPHSPSRREQEIIEQITDLAGVAIQRKLTEEQLRRSEVHLQRQASLLEQSHDAIFVWEFPGPIVYWNRGAEHLYGFSREEAVGRRSHELLRTEHPMPTDVFEALIEQQGGWSGELTQLTRDGRTIVVDSRHVLMREADGPSLVLETNRDITGRKRSEDERERLHQLEADLAHMNRLTTMSELTSSLAHEIRQPITAAIINARTCLRWLQRDRPEIAEAREAASRAINDTMRAADIISRIRTLFKKEARTSELVDVNGLIQEAILLLRSEASQYSIGIDAALARDLPRIPGDRVLLQQVVMNLMVNGIDAMKGMSPPGRLTVASALGERELLISVTDTGVGLPTERASRMFDAFFTTKPHGTGMGLTISRSIVESHGGRVWASANPGSGATFHVTLPTEAGTVDVIPGDGNRESLKSSTPEIS